jgi:hypothetical protein
MLYFVEVWKEQPSERVRRLGPMEENKAEKVEAGLDQRIDHDNYFCQIVDEEGYFK